MKDARGLGMGEKGFSLIEILAGMTIFMFGMLGVAALLTATVRDNAFSANVSEASMLASTEMDILLSVPYTNSILTDTDGDGVAGLDHIGDAGAADEADHRELDVGKNKIFNVYWNVADNEVATGTKTINVIVTWSDREDLNRRLNFRVVRGDQY